MTFSKSGLVAVSLAVLVASGCSTSRFSSMDDQQPAPLQPAPAGKVTANQLPPPAAPGAADPSQFPTAPANTQVASAPPSDGSAPAGAADLTAASVAGVWNASVSGQSCKVATPQTKFGAGFRAGPLHCPAPIDGIKSWNVAGKQLTLYDENGGTLARLYSSSGSKFDGQTSNGQPISLTR
ncbi:protease inhibitor Inh/omp19 family protein [Mesorhizobium sp. AR07]|uniref:protease inhibitor Inh/omp19 family protein n=1 Tax=Mesorhizobium sp. AR07 TaxID=2865838 RepID=UPI00215FE10B|nr:protease inhibitor Inh/omp19 family protein [Mesorhizobium sp. AR07]UVK42541.1 protease inhibitor Inh/omp19 family protein [Mesorhizobium sp. AR07]